MSWVMRELTQERERKVPCIRGCGAGPGHQKSGDKEENEEGLPGQEANNIKRPPG